MWDAHGLNLPAAWNGPRLGHRWHVTHRRGGASHTQRCPRRWKPNLPELFPETNRIERVLTHDAEEWRRRADQAIAAAAAATIFVQLELRSANGHRKQLFTLNWLLCALFLHTLKKMKTTSAICSLIQTSWHLWLFNKGTFKLLVISKSCNLCHNKD